jgi:hypothetical protein
MQEKYSTQDAFSGIAPKDNAFRVFSKLLTKRLMEVVELHIPDQSLEDYIVGPL